MADQGSRQVLQGGWRFAVAMWLYSGLMVLMQPLLRFKLKRRGRAEPGYLQNTPERFGQYAQTALQASGLTVWVHAVSLGEARAAAPLLEALRQRWPDMRLLLTHGTATGRAAGQKLLRPGDVQAWQPWDTPTAVQRFLRHFRPDVGILMETEVWPNLVAQSRQAGVPLVLANARMSPRSQNQAQRLRLLSKPLFGAFTAIYAQTEHDAERLVALGAPADCTSVMGNLKYDTQPDPRLLARGRQWRSAGAVPVVLLASSREGEEQLWLTALQELLARKDVSPVQWLVVPRHPQRFGEVADLIVASGLTVSRRSQWASSGPALTGGPQLLLGDSLGEMPLYYGLADLCLLGGSFEPLGGQNLIEAAACACPVIMGPHTFNFSQAAEQALASGAAWRVPDMAKALELALGLLADTHGLKLAQSAAKTFSDAHQGAAKRMVDALFGLQHGRGA